MTLTSVLGRAFAGTLLLAGPATAAPWQRAVPTPGVAGQLFAVFCSTPASCVAVGDYGKTGSGTLTQALHWNGRRWFVTGTPNPGGTAPGNFNELLGVACASAADCWAVGVYTLGRASLNLALHWNGRTWSKVRTPNPGGTGGGGSALLGVRCRASGNCWAVGTYEAGSVGTAPLLNQVLHWNGRRWSQVPAANPAGTNPHAFNELNGLACTSDDNCWAVGIAGHSLPVARAAGFVTVGPLAESGTARTATGSATLNQALHWNGRRWSAATVPQPAGTAGVQDENQLFSVFCAAPRDCWAAGYIVPGDPTGQTRLNQLLHWNGRRWSFDTQVPDPDGTGGGAANQINSVTCTAAANCWAVGNYGRIDTGGNGVVINQVLHWNGHRWALTRSTPNPAGTANGDQNQLTGVRCTSASFCWAVGSQTPKGARFANEALRWNGAHWLVG